MNSCLLIGWLLCNKLTVLGRVLFQDVLCSLAGCPWSTQMAPFWPVVFKQHKLTLSVCYIIRAGFPHGHCLLCSGNYLSSLSASISTCTHFQKFSHKGVSALGASSQDTRYHVCLSFSGVLIQYCTSTAYPTGLPIREIRHPQAGHEHTHFGHPTSDFTPAIWEPPYNCSTQHV